MKPLAAIPCVVLFLPIIILLLLLIIYSSIVIMALSPVTLRSFLGPSHIGELSRLLPLFTFIKSLSCCHDQLVLPRLMRGHINYFLLILGGHHGDFPLLRPCHLSIRWQWAREFLNPSKDASVPKVQQNGTNHWRSWTMTKTNDPAT